MINWACTRGVRSENQDPHVSMMRYPPPLVTPAACRAAKMGKYGRKAKTSRWRNPVCATATAEVVRIENNNPDGFRQPMPFMLKSVQRPPMTPAPDVTPYNNGLIQSPWVSRSDPPAPLLNIKRTPLPEITSQYSIKELIDALCGDGPEIPELLEAFPRKIPNRNKDREVLAERNFNSNFETSAMNSYRAGLNRTETNLPNFKLEPMNLPPNIFEETGGAWGSNDNESFFSEPINMPSSLFEGSDPKPATTKRIATLSEPVNVGTFQREQPRQNDFGSRASRVNAGTSSTAINIPAGFNFGRQPPSAAIIPAASNNLVASSAIPPKRFEDFCRQTNVMSMAETSARPIMTTTAINIVTTVRTPSSNSSTHVSSTSKSPNDFTTSAAVSPFFAGGLAYIQSVYEGSESDESQSPTFNDS